MAQAPIRIVFNGAFGTVRSAEGDQPLLPIRPGVIYDIAWLEENPIDMQFGSGASDALDFNLDEIDGGNLTVVTETAFQLEATDLYLSLN